MKAKYLRYACILIGILVLGAIALLISVAILWGTGGSGVLLFAMIYAVAAVAAIPLAVTFLVLSITKREPHRWFTVFLLVLSLPIIWRGTGLLFQFGEGLTRDFFARHDRQTPRDRGSQAQPATAPQASQTPSSEPLEIHLKPVEGAVISQQPAAADSQKARADERKR